MENFIGEVTQLVNLTGDVIGLSITAPKEFKFLAGQFVTIQIESKDKKRMKSYSILNEPSQGNQIDFCIKLIEGGFASEIFKKTKIGDKFSIKGPFGHFVFDEESKVNEHFLIGTGTGMAPLYSMVKEWASKRPNTKFTLLTGYRHESNILLHKELLQLQSDLDNFTYIVTLTRPNEEWHGMSGRVHEHLGNDVENKKFYICGLKDMVIETRDKLREMGVSKENLAYERYS